MLKEILEVTFNTFIGFYRVPNGIWLVEKVKSQNVKLLAD